MESRKYKSEMREVMNAKTPKDAKDRLLKIYGEIKLPKKLYRYRPINEYLMDELVNQHIYLSAPVSDDIFDSKLMIMGRKLNPTLSAARFNYECAQLAANEEEAKEFKENYQIYDAIFREINEEIHRNVRISCFAESNKNMPMWWYYADRYKGACVEYTIDTAAIEKEGMTNLFLPVIYTKMPGEYLGDEFGDAWSEMLSIMSSVLKLEDWAFEKEWRIISYCNERDKKELSSRQTQEGVEADSELQDNFHLKLKMSAIYFGINAHTANKEMICSYIDKNNLDIKLFDVNAELTGLETNEIKY